MSWVIDSPPTKQENWKKLKTIMREGRMKIRHNLLHNIMSEENTPVEDDQNETPEEKESTEE